jgi:hypothetical protein
MAKSKLTAKSNAFKLDKPLTLYHFEGKVVELKELFDAICNTIQHFIDVIHQVTFIGIMNNGIEVIARSPDSGLKFLLDPKFAYLSHEELPNSSGYKILYERDFVYPSTTSDDSSSQDGSEVSEISAVSRVFNPNEQPPSSSLGEDDGDKNSLAILPVPTHKFVERWNLMVPNDVIVPEKCTRTLGCHSVVVHETPLEKQVNLLEKELHNNNIYTSYMIGNFRLGQSPSVDSVTNTKLDLCYKLDRIISELSFMDSVRVTQAYGIKTPAITSLATQKLVARSEGTEEQVVSFDNLATQHGLAFSIATHTTFMCKNIILDKYGMVVEQRYSIKNPILNFISKLYIKNKSLMVTSQSDEVVLAQTLNQIEYLMVGQEQIYPMLREYLNGFNQPGAQDFCCGLNKKRLFVQTLATIGCAMIVPWTISCLTPTLITKASISVCSAQSLIPPQILSSVVLPIVGRTLLWGCKDEFSCKSQRLIQQVQSISEQNTKLGYSARLLGDGLRIMTNNKYMNTLLNIMGEIKNNAICEDWQASQANPKSQQEMRESQLLSKTNWLPLKTNLSLESSNSEVLVLTLGFLCLSVFLLKTLNTNYIQPKVFLIKEISNQKSQSVWTLLKEVWQFQTKPMPSRTQMRLYLTAVHGMRMWVLRRFC